MLWFILNVFLRIACRHNVIAENVAFLLFIVNVNVAVSQTVANVLYATEKCWRC